MKEEFKKNIAQKTNEELLEIFSNPEMYQQEFVFLVEEELSNRSIIEEHHKQERNNRLEKETELKMHGIAGDETYLTASLIFAIMGGLLGIVGGYVYAFTKKDGEFYYNETTRKRGKFIFFIGLFVFLLILAWQIDNNK